MEWNIFSEKFIWKQLCTTPCILEPGWTCCSLLIYWSEWCRFYFAVFIQCRRFIFWIIITKKARSSKFWQKRLSRWGPSFTYFSTPCNYNRCSHWKNIYLLHHQLRGKILPQNYSNHLVLLNINLWCWN